VQPCPHRRGGGAPDCESLHEPSCRRLQRGQGGRTDGVGVLARGAALELEIGEHPPLRAVLQRDNGIRDAEVDKSLRADDAAGAAGAIHDDAGPGIANDARVTVGQLRVGAADAARNVHLPVFGQGPPIEDDEVLAAGAHAGELLRRHARRVAGVLDQLSK
jgi:hypothetical protein